jgi:hypothetical protein
MFEGNDTSADLNLPHKERRIGKHQYRATILQLNEWFRLEGIAIEALGDPLEKLLGAFPVDLKTQQVDLGALQTEQIAEVLHGLIRGLGPEKLSALVGSMAGAVDVMDADGRWRRLSEDKLQIHFRLNMRELVPALLLHLEVQFADFFAGALSLLSEIGLTAERKSSSATSEKPKGKDPHLSPSPIT